MAIVVTQENVFPAYEIPDHVPRKRHKGRLKKIHKATGYRWIWPGVRGVQLEHINIGGTIYTSEEALQRFFERLTAAPSSPAPQRTSAASRAAERANTELAQLGIR